MELDCLVACPIYDASNPILFCILMEFGGNLFRWRSSTPSSIWAFVDGNKIMLSLAHLGVSSLEQNECTVHPARVFVPAPELSGKRAGLHGRNSDLFSRIER